MPNKNRQSNYLIDAENVEEMARLNQQAKLLNEHLSLLPVSVSLPPDARVLDIGCGPGQWVLDFAQQYPQNPITGIDMSKIMIAYAQACAQERHLTTTDFQWMDARNLTFPAHSFDFIHGRLLVGFMTRSTWPILLQRCFQMLRPGGIFCSIEVENLFANSPALNQVNAWMVQALWKAGHAFVPQGQVMGMLAAQEPLLRKAGFKTRQELIVANFSYGCPLYAPLVEVYAQTYLLLRPFIVKSGQATEEEAAQTVERAIAEMHHPDFSALGCYHRVWGQVP